MPAQVVRSTQRGAHVAQVRSPFRVEAEEFDQHLLSRDQKRRRK
jgi:hypothetical protein